ncbi:FtsX-like permease family protein [Streptomyces sp. NPDC051940]|uniref:ABC transporter permease n=1 Tax=Streptomyces sp. NPDC051940 TaxID=3155675 RepID=UPI003437DC72
MTVMKTSMRNFFAHKGRMALSAIAVVLSVAFVCGTLVFSDTMNTTFDKLFKATAADVTVSPKDLGSGDDQQSAEKDTPTLPAADLKKVEAAKGVKSVHGDVTTIQATVADKDDENLGSTTGAPTIVTDWDQGELKIVKLTSGHTPRGPTESVIDADVAKKHKLKIGDEVRIIAVPGSFTTKLVGIATFQTTNPGATVVYLDTATAQTKLFGKPDVYTQIMATTAPGFTHEAVKKNVAAELGTDYKVQTKAEVTAENKDDVGSFLDVMKYAMLGFAGIAFLVGIFLIVNTFSMLVAQRTREIGLMRAIGSSRKQVNRSVLVEALLLGVIGSALGVAAGVGIAIGLMKLMSGMGMHLDTADLTVKATTPVWGMLLGVVVTVLAAYLPARRAGKVSPMAALRDAGTPADGKAGWIRASVGLVLTGAGGAALFAAAQADKATEGSQFLGLGVVLSLLGFIVIGPLLAGVVVKVISAGVLRIFGPVGRMAERNALRNPRRTGATASALMIGLALVASLSVVGSSMVASATDELDKSVGADFIIQSDTGQAILPEAAEAIKNSPDLEHVTEYKEIHATLTYPNGKVEKDTDFSAATPSYAEDLRVEAVSGELNAAYAPDAMSVNEKIAKKYGAQVGDKIKVDFADGSTATLTLAAITSADTTIDNGAKYMAISTAEKYVPANKMPRNEIMFGKAVEGKADQAYAALKKELKPYPQYTVRDQTDFKQALKDQVGQLLTMVNGLLALAIIVAVLGVVNTLALSVVERTREIGLSRAIGMSRRQLRRMIRLESVVIALFGALLGLGLGMAWGASAQQLLALEGLKVLDIPWGTIGTVFAGSALVGLLAALVPAWRAGRMNILNAIATD